MLLFIALKSDSFCFSIFCEYVFLQLIIVFNDFFISLYRCKHNVNAYNKYQPPYQSFKKKINKKLRL
jgi:hypothetical protein